MGCGGRARNPSWGRPLRRPPGPTGITNITVSIDRGESVLPLTVGGAVKPAAVHQLESTSRLSSGQPWTLLEAVQAVFNSISSDLVPGVGIDFAFVRTHRSRTGRTTPMGHGWDHSYNLYIESEGDDVGVCDGTGRRDVMFRQADGTFSRDEFFWHGRWDDTTGNFILEFPGKGVWEFYNSGLLPVGGRIARIADANGNQLQFTYDLQARLIEAVGTSGRTLIFDFTPDGFLSSLADFTRRRWTYTYYSNRSTGGVFTVSGTNWILQERLSLSAGHRPNSPSGWTKPVVVPAVFPTKFYRLFKA